MSENKRKNFNIIYKEIDEIKPYKQNPRKISDKAIEVVKNSIAKFGIKQPLVIDKNNEIICGHTRLKALNKLREENNTKIDFNKIPCVLADDLTKSEIKAYRLADNKTSEFSLWDDDLLNIELDEIKLDDIKMEDFGFEDITKETKELEEVEPEEVDDIDVKVKDHDIYELGNHRLMCGDSTKAEDVAELIGGGKVDCVFTDMPYGMNLDTDFSGMKNKLNFAKEQNIKNGKKYDRGKVDDFTPEMIENIFNCFDYVKEMFLWGADYFAELIPDKNKGSWIVWDKRASENSELGQDLSSDKMYGSCFELCWSKNKHKRDIARVKWAGVFGIEQEFDHKRHHPTQKPIKLVQWFLNRYTKNGWEVVDLFGGSGSTLIACEQLNRKCYMMEIDKKYCQVIINRWEKLTGKKAKKINK